jgi:predicted NodU family carbamoyl transferase
MKLFIGTNYGHGAAIAAINESGELVFAVEEGRLVGEKDCDRFPTIALHMILNKFSPDTLQWAEGWDRWKRFINKGILTTLKYGIFDTSYYRARLIKEIYRLYNGLNIEFEWRRLLNTPSFTGHHLAHAFSLLPWGLPAKSLILISDTTAESAAISIFYWCGSTMYLLLDVPYPHSPGAAFHQMAVHLGFRGRTAPGKLMALAAYGQPKWVDELRSFCKITNQGFRFDLNHYPAWHRKSAWRRFATNSASRSLRDAILSRIDCGDQGCDLARSVQDWFTVITLDIIRHSLYIARNHHGFEVKHIGLAGGFGS